MKVSSTKMNSPKEETELEFLKKTFKRQIEERVRTKPRGVPPSKKRDIIDKLLPLMPSTRYPFWHNLAENSSCKDLATDYE